MKAFHRLVTFILSLTFCGCFCNGYGTDGYPYRPQVYESVLVLRDEVDTIKTIEYTNTPGIIEINKNITPIKISFIQPTIITVKTSKNIYSFTLNKEVKYNYYNDRKCETSGVDFEPTETTLVESSSEKIAIKRAKLNISSMEVSYKIVDSIIINK